MADIIVKKKITLEFLGEEHAGDYLVFKAVPINEFDKLQEGMPDVAEGEVASKEANQKATQLMLKILEDKFLEGRFQEQDVVKSDMGKFDGGTVAECFKLVTGQKTDPKD